MSTNTPNLDLFKWNLSDATDKASQFNIPVSLNNNWDKIDTAVGNLDTAVEDKVDKVQGKGLSTEDYTTAEKTKLAEIEAQANKTVVDSSLDSSSTNPVQNKKVKEALDEKQDQIDALNTYTKKLEKQVPTGTASGSSVQLTDSAGGLAIENVAVWGATSQAQYEGYNLLDLATLNGKTVNGITVVKNVDDSLTFNGTSTQGFAIYNHTINLTLPAGNYINSIGRTIVSGVYISLDSIDNTMISGDSISQKSFTLTQEKTYSSYYIWINNGITLNNFTIYPMVYSGTTTKDYEPYCGEKASPNKDYPQAVHCVTGDCNVKMHNKNFFNKASTTFTSSKTLDTSTGEVIAGSSSSWAVSDFIPIYRTKNATISGKLVENNYNMRICAYDENKNFITGVTIANTGAVNKFTITATEDFCYVRFVKFREYYDADTVQLEIGSTATSYQGFAKNLYNNSTNTTRKYLTQDGTPSSISGWNTSDYIALETTKKYKYSGLTNVGIAPYSCYYDANKQFISSFKQATGTNYLTVPANAVYVRFSIIDADINTFSLIIDQSTQLTLGNLKLYEGDKIQISYTEKAGYKTVTGANVVKNIEKEVLDGTTKKFFNKGQSSANNVYITNGISNIQKPSTNADVVNIKCNYVKGNYSVNDLYANDIQGCAVRSDGVLVFGFGINSNLTTVELANGFLTNNLVEIVYPLTTPTTTPITDTTLLSQLEALINMETYKGITNIDTEGEDLAPVLEFTYCKDLDTIIYNLQQAVLNS